MEKVVKIKQQVVNKVEAVVREITSWLEEYETENGVSEFVKRRRERNE